jgi:hypothetical protein
MLLGLGWTGLRALPARGGIDRYVTLPALLGYIAMTVGVFGIARRLGVEKLEALFAALLFTTLPVVVLQPSGALNDLVVGSFLVICVYFCLGGRTVDAVLAGLALALAFGTKAYAPLALPLIVTIAVLAASRSHALKLAAFGVAAVILGSTWNLINLVKTGSYLGHVQNETDYSVHGVLSILALPVRYLIDFVEVPGAKGWRAAAYVVAVLVIGASWLRSRPSPSRRSLIVAAVVAGTPFLVIAFGPLIDRAYRAFFFDLSRPDLGILGHDRSIFTASPVISYYGPLGLVLLFSPLAFFAARRERRALLVVFAAAPFLFSISSSAHYWLRRAERAVLCLFDGIRSRALLACSPRPAHTVGRCRRRLANAPFRPLREPREAALGMGRAPLEGADASGSRPGRCIQVHGNLHSRRRTRWSRDLEEAVELSILRTTASTRRLLRTIGELCSAYRRLARCRFVEARAAVGMAGGHGRRPPLPCLQA